MTSPTVREDRETKARREATEVLTKALAMVKGVDGRNDVVKPNDAMWFHDSLGAAWRSLGHALSAIPQPTTEDE